VKNINVNSAQVAGKHIPKNYNEIVALLDQAWSVQADATLNRIKVLDKALGSPSSKLKTIFIGGSNGKSLTMHFLNKLLKEEGYNAGTFDGTRFLNYNEQISQNNELISNENFTDLANQVLTAAQTENLKISAKETLTMIALLHFVKSKADLAVFEINNNLTDPALICNPIITGITRINTENGDSPNIKPASEETLNAILNTIKPKTKVISADQSKTNLSNLSKLTEDKKAEWITAIRKIVELEPPFNQLHGRSAALAERIAQLYVDNFVDKSTIVAQNSLLVEPDTTKGRPTLEAKKARETNPRRTLEEFWQEVATTLPGRFELSSYNGKKVLLDNASNIDALKNLFLGIRLLHYKNHLKGITLIFGGYQNIMDIDEFFKQIRYFLKKNTGQLILCPIEDTVPGHKNSSWKIEELAEKIVPYKIKHSIAPSFAKALELAKDQTDANGLIVISGSDSIVTKFMKIKG